MLITEDGEFVEITKKLKKMKIYDKTSPIARAGILGYELGRVQEYVVKKEQKNLSGSFLNGLSSEAKLGMADLIIMCRMVCIENKWDFDEIQKMGMDHLKERHQDFKKDGFAGEN